MRWVITGFPTDVENMEGLCPPPCWGDRAGGSSKFDEGGGGGGGLSQKIGGA